VFERSIGIRLTLLPAFAEATKLILSNIGEINKGLQSINEQGSKINVEGLQNLNRELGSLVGAAGAAKTALESLNGIKISKSVLSALEIGMTGVAASAKVTKEKIQEVGVQAVQTAAVVETQTAEMSKSFFNLNEEIMIAERALAKLGFFALPKMDSSVVGMRNLNSELALAESAMRRLDTFVPQNLESSILRLNSGLRNMAALTGGNTALMLGSGRNGFSLGGSPQEQLDASRQRMLTAGNYTGNDIAPYRSALPGTTPYEPGHQVYEGPGSITPYVQDLGRGSWMPNGAQMATDYGPRPMPNYGSEGVTAAGRGIMRQGDIMQSAGWAAAMNAIMVASVAEPIVKQLVELGNIYQASAEAYQAVGMKPENYGGFNKYIEQASTQYGGSLRENVAAGYTFASSVPAAAKVDWNDPKQQAEMGESIKRIIQANIAGGRPTHPLQLEHTVLDILASVSNLGMPMANAKELGNSIKILTDVFTNVKNTTSTDFDLLGTSVRNVGAVARNMGVSWQDTMAVLALEAEGKYRGSIAGTSLKRIMSRQAMDPAQARKMEAVVEHFGGNASMFGKSGAAISPLDFFANIGKFEDQHHLPAKQRGQLEGALSGLYAGAPMGELINLSRAFGGSEGLKKYRDKVIGGAPGATEKAYGTRDEHGKNIAIESTKLQNTAMLEADKTFKLIEPDIIKAFQALEKLITAWNGLSDPTKKFIVDSSAVLFGLSAVGGILGILGGNFLKFGGTMLFAGGHALKLAEHLVGMAGNIPMLSRAMGILPGVFGAASSAAIALQVAIGPIGWAIEAVIAVTALFALAWSKDWGGIREKVAGFPEFLGEIVGHIQVWFGQIPKHLQEAGNKIKEVWNGIWDGTLGIFKNIWNGIQNIISGGFHFPTINWPKPPDWLGQFKSGVSKGATAEQISEGIFMGPTGTPGGSHPVGPTLAAAHRLAQVHAAVVGAVNAGTQGGSSGGGGGYTAPAAYHAPAAITAPISAKPSVNAGASDQEVADAIAALYGAPKKAKAKKTIADSFLVLKSETIGQVEEAAAKITQALEKSGAVIHKKWIDILDPKNFKVTRVFGDVSAFQQALGTKDIDKSMQVAHDYLLKIKREIEHGVPVDMSKVIANLTVLAAHAMSEHAKNSIVQMSDTITNAFHMAGNKIAKAFENTKKGFESQLITVQGAGNRFDLIQQNAKIPDAGDTTKSMSAAIKVETAERNALASALFNEEQDLTRLQVRYKELTAEIAQYNGSSKYAQELRIKDKAELEGVTDALDGATARVVQQKSVVDDLTASILKQANALKLAKDTWSGMFYNIQQHNAALMIDQNFKSMADHIQNYFQRQNLPTGPAGNSAGRQQANDFANQFIQQIFQGISGTSATTTLEKIMHAGTKGHKGSKHEAGTPPTQAETQYIQKVDKSNDHLSNIVKNTNYLNPANVGTKIGGAVSTNNSGPMPVSLFDQTGGSEIGTSLVQSQQDLTSKLSAQFDSTMSGVKITPDQTAAQTSLQKFQSLADSASQAMTLISGLKAGGAGGALEAGSAAFQMTGNPYIAAGAAVIGFIGIGPHETAAQQPDINDPFYKQLLANWAGTQQTAGGQVMQPGAGYSSYLGAQNEAQQMYNFASNPASQIGMNPAQKASIQQLLGLAGGKGAAGLAIASEHQGELTLASGQKIAVSDFDTLIQNSQGLLDSFNNNVLQQQQNADRLASSFTSFVLNGPSGFKMPDFVGGGSGTAGSVHRMPSPMTSRTAGVATATPVAANVTVHILAGATINEGSTAQIEQAIQNQLPAITQAVNGGNFLEVRRSGSYVSSNW
jgi:TP901 family phage tail tape measure protein